MFTNISQITCHPQNVIFVDDKLSVKTAKYLLAYGISL